MFAGDTKKPIAFGSRPGGKHRNPQELTEVSGWGERVQPTTR
ncbi:addiction module toxin RelE [Serratia marcescens subsp. marcescens ATCC 13880]|nr:addiction module toxin RelE [Serratia marcescens]PNU45615.1 addiction module toxin RelE [Serratia marcescens subsp. marcescens ATCC 13880]RFT82123.1 addiction module toxin RelE [Serratia marcescens]HAU96170.1 addiction module toxin RelE [Serratia marcescens]